MQQNAIQVIPNKPLDMRVPVILRGIIDKLKQAQGGFSLFHFTLTLGRLRIELSRAKGKPLHLDNGGN